MGNMDICLRKKRGQSAVELAITMPILLLILCGIIEFGWIISHRMILSYTSREGARYAAVNTTNENIEDNTVQRVRSVAPAHIRDELEITVIFTDVHDVRSGDIEVVVKTDLKTLTPIGGIFFSGKTVDISSYCVMKVE